MPSPACELSQWFLFLSAERGLHVHLLPGGCPSALCCLSSAFSGFTTLPLKLQIDMSRKLKQALFLLCISLIVMSENEIMGVTLNSHPLY